MATKQKDLLSWDNDILDSGSVYDQIETKTQKEVNSELRSSISSKATQSDVNALRNSLESVKGDIGYVENGDTCTKTNGIPANRYVIWKGALYTSNRLITNGESLSGLLTAVPNGGLNDLKDFLSAKVDSDSGVTLTASTNITIDSSNVSRSGNVIQFFITVTLSANIGTYVKLFEFNKRAASTTAFPLYSGTQFLKPTFTDSVYISGNTREVCAGDDGIVAGSYLITGMFITKD